MKKVFAILAIAVALTSCDEAKKDTPVEPAPDSPTNNATSPAAEAKANDSSAMKSAHPIIKDTAIKAEK